MEKNIKKLLIGFFAIMITFTLISRAAASAMVPRVEVAAIKSGDLDYEVYGTGIIQADAHDYIELNSGYKVDEVAVKEGQQVEEGDLLFSYDIDALEQKKSGLQSELKKLELQYESVGLTNGSTTATGDKETAELAIEAAKKDKEKAEAGLVDKKSSVKEKMEDKYKEALEAYEAMKASMEKEQKSADRAVLDAQEKLDELKQPEYKADTLLINYEAAVDSNTDMKLQNAQDDIYDYYYDGKYKEHKEAVSNAEKLLTRAKEDLEETEEKWEKIVMVWYDYYETDAKNSYYERLKQKEDELSRVKRAVEDAQKTLEDLTETDNKLSGAIAAYQDCITGAVEYDNGSRKILSDFILKGKTAEQADMDAAQTKLSRAKEDQEQTTVDWKGKLKAEEEKINELSQDLQAIDAGKYDYSKDLKEEMNAYDSSVRALEQAELQLKQLELNIETGEEQKEELEKSITLQKKILQIDIEEKQLELNQLNRMISEKGEVRASVPGKVTDNDLVQGTLLTGQEKLIITTGGYELVMNADMEELKYFSIGDELKLKLEADSTSITSQIENIELPDAEGKVEFTAILPEGDYQIGVSLDYELSKASETYSMCLPIQALRQDASGAYILLAKEKDSVLGNITEAFRVNVSVLSKDLKSVAVDAALTDKDSIITGSNKNFAEGDRVRIYEME